MRLGFHYHIPACEDHGKIFIPGYLGCFVDSLADRCSEVVLFLHSPSQRQKKFLDYPIQHPNVQLVDIGPYVSVPRRLMNSRGYTKHLETWHDRLDALLIRGPSPLLPQMAAAAGKVPVALLLVGDNREGIDSLPQPSWRKTMIRLLWKWNHQLQRVQMRKSLTFVNSHKLYNAYHKDTPDLVEVRTTTLSEDDFFTRSDTCQSKPIKLLYTGRLSRAKGLSDMVLAVKVPRDSGLDVELRLVGWSEPNDQIEDEIKAEASRLGISDYIKNLGYRKLGPDLFQCYREADIYLIASQSSFEGFPRTIWEAMANSLPVVATKVGSIPDFVGNCAVLVEPQNPEALASGIQKVIQHPDLRQCNIKKALALAKQNTLEIQAQKMVDEIEFWVRDHNAS